MVSEHNQRELFLVPKPTVSVLHYFLNYYEKGKNRITGVAAKGSRLRNHLLKVSKETFTLIVLLTAPGKSGELPRWLFRRIVLDIGRNPTAYVGRDRLVIPTYSTVGEVDEKPGV
jgi:hypothetical protein